MRVLTDRMPSIVQPDDWAMTEQAPTRKYAPAIVEMSGDDLRGMLLKKRGRNPMYLIEYLSTSTNRPSATYTELALGSTPEEAMDQANTHMPKLAAKFGAQSYRIIDPDKRCVGIGPVGFLSTQVS